MARVNPVPDGFHSVTPYMVLKDTGSAINFYKKAFGAEERFRMPGPDGKTIMHAEIQIGDSIIMMSEENAEYGCFSPQTLKDTPVSIHLYVEDVNAAHERAVSAGAESMMPPMDMFWGDRFCKVKDPFGHKWTIATHVEDVPPEQMADRMKKAFSQPC